MDEIEELADKGFTEAVLPRPLLAGRENLLIALRLEWGNAVCLFPLADASADIHSLGERFPKAVVQFVYFGA